MSPMDVKRKRHIFNFFGAVVIIVWLVMMGLLVKKVSFNYDVDKVDIIAEKRSAITTVEREWMDIYLKGKKVGYSVNQVSPLEEDYLIQEEIFLKLNLMGQASSIYTVSRSLVDHAFLLKSFRFKMISGVVTYQISGRVKGNLMILEIGEGTARRKEIIKLSAPPLLGSGMARFFKGRKLEVDSSFRVPVFDPSTMAQKEAVFRVMAKESVVIKRMRHSAFRLETEMWGQPMTMWLDEKGAVLKEQGFMGFTLIKSSAANAPRDIEGGGGEDFYELAAINVKGKLKDADRLAYLKLKVDGLVEADFDTAILAKGRQTFGSGMIEIIREKMPSKAVYDLPYSDGSDSIKKFLRPGLSIESDDSAVMEKAREIAGKVKNPTAVARRLMAWVFRNVKKRPLITVPSALEVLKTKVGDCNEHAVLLTALLRAAGIPARLCVGVVYSRGSFFYHAWTESYLGEWISMDATLNQMPADVTHIKLVQGGLDMQMEIIGLIGKIKLKVVDYRY
ncbi:MAG: transglutaminase domain-containing protein [Deltaproteobacteria bacterium]|nr:transglutaminase domain-containing protein [Deltaproteobacteria bacterium]